MISGRKLALRKNHWKIYLLILMGLLYNLHLAFQTHSNSDMQKTEKPRKNLKLPDSSSHFGIAADSLKNKETLTLQF